MKCKKCNKVIATKGIPFDENLFDNLKYLSVKQKDNSYLCVECHNKIQK